MLEARRRERRNDQGHDWVLSANELGRYVKTVR